MRRNRAFQNAMKRQVGRVVEFGPGTGDSTTAIVEYLCETLHWPSLIAIDLNKTVLTAALQRVAKSGCWHQLNKIAAIRCEFGKLPSLDACLPSDFADSAEATAYVVLGNLFGELEPDAAMRLFAGAKAGDLVVISGELAHTLDGRRLDAKETLRCYQMPEATCRWETVAEVIHSGGTFSLSPEEHENGAFAIIAKRWKGNADTEIYRVTRFTASDLVRKFQKAGFEFIAWAGAPDRPCYGYMVFRKLPAVLIAPLAAPDGQGSVRVPEPA